MRQRLSFIIIIEETEDAEALEDLLEREYHATDEEKKEMRADIQEVLQFFYDYGMIEEMR